MSRMNSLHLDTKDMTVESMEKWGRDLAELQKSCNWWIGDLAIAAKAKLGEDNYSQVFPTDVSIGLIQRCEAVARAYAPQERNPGASWTIHMQHVNKPNRIALVAAAVDAGRTSDEERQRDKQQKAAFAVGESVKVAMSSNPFYGHVGTVQQIETDLKTAFLKFKDGKTEWFTFDELARAHRWLLAIDVNYWVTRMWASGAGIEAAKEVSAWIKRTVVRLKEKGLTDVVCCFDSGNNFRKELTKDWGDDNQYKNRATKDQELGQQLRIAEEMLSEFCCAKADTFEADDLMASYAKQFTGHVTLLTVDKDMRQCLSPKCNMLVAVEWTEDPTSGEMLPDYKWVSVKDHTGWVDEKGNKQGGFTYNNTHVWGITPEQMTTFQALAGDSSDSITGAVGIGPKIAENLIKEFETIEAIIKAAKDDDPRITKAKRAALIEFESKVEITRKLVTLVTDLPLPTTTKV